MTGSNLVKEWYHTESNLFSYNEHSRATPP